MPAQSVAPTKSNLLKEKERLALAEEGYVSSSGSARSSCSSS